MSASRRINAASIGKAKFAEQTKSFAYGQSRPWEEQLAEVARLRREHFGDEAMNSRMAKAARIVRIYDVDTSDGEGKA